jgi:hypothetical protein
MTLWHKMYVIHDKVIIATEAHFVLELSFVIDIVSLRWRSTDIFGSS